ncbi:Di-trans-poly-cis-decaprenylcistransferase [Artomyces pyxidatus]|uniref:Di-trans-poly-cis-decaprenylcistransferase n=1 Tax=Artomyces pyxidatus TaxID=48021 RepID=A0ACB8TH91_9AGAM|nr:Di-trans-poly-cis-decaprenylcistransferase [Artomyces pyxidatus]
MEYVSRSLASARTAVLDRAQRAVIAVLKTGPIPRHVAFVMDGNRRYARTQGMHVLQGHRDGFIALRRMLEICFLLGVQCVTVYSFSIDNFKRSQEEVDGLMSLAEDKLLELCEHGGILQQYGARINGVGKTELFPPHVRAAVAKAEELTRHNDKKILNLCMPYTSTDEIKTALEGTVNEAMRDAVEKGRPASPITEDDIDAHLMTSKCHSPPLDILVRTSGVKRLSDFLLWQCVDDTQIQFIDTYWPDISLLDLVPVILDYQRKAWAL